MKRLRDFTLKLQVLFPRLYVCFSVSLTFLFTEEIVPTLHHACFSLQTGDKTMSSKEYLENALKQDDDAIDEASLRQDGVRAMIKAFFPQLSPFWIVGYSQFCLTVH